MNSTKCLILQLRHHRVVEEVEHALQARTRAQPQRLALVAGGNPSTLVLVLVLPLLGEADTGLGLDVVPPHVLRALAVGPDVLTRDRAGVATETLVEVEHHRYLTANSHRILLT